MSRKTVKVGDLVDYVNNLLATYDEQVVDKSFIIGQRALLERILHDTGNYRGYSHIGHDYFNPNLGRTGIHWEWVGHPDRYNENMTVDRAFIDTDPNRVRYYKNWGLY